ncbi:MAG: peptide chain release factor N(5)-glutamine methyltransferase [Chloroflexi bacterium]|nr:peptide chain release factor N(5)-glutamine methyltransferase [Chloroflexota bacterium]
MPPAGTRGGPPPEPLQPGTRLETALASAQEMLRRAGVDQPRLVALASLAAALGVEKATVLAHPERLLTAEEAARFAAALTRLRAREPLAYVLGEREFYGRPFFVTPAVLVPRPETELLVELALDYLRGRMLADDWLADVGTGSGAIAVTLAVERPDLRLLALDLSWAALVVARANARRHGVEDRTALVCADLLGGVRGPLAVVLANLPYIPSALIDGLQPEVAAYEPRLALDGGPDGLALIRRLLGQLPSRLAAGGLAVVEFGAEQADAVRALAAAAVPGADLAIVRDLAGLPRALRIVMA